MRVSMTILLACVLHFCYPVHCQNKQLSLSMFIFRRVMCLYFRPLRTRFVERWFDDSCVGVLYLGNRVVVPYFGIAF